MKRELLNRDRDAIGPLVIHADDDLDRPSPGERAGQRPDVHLIQPDQRALRAGEKHVGVRAANGRNHSRKRAAVANPRPERNKKQLISRRAQIDRHGFELVGR